MVSSRVLFGMFLALTGSAMNATGLNLQRLGQKLEQDTDDGKQKRKAKLVNFLGIFLSTSCGLLDIISFQYAPQTVLAPFGAVTLVFNLLLAPLVQGDKLEFLDIVSTSFVVVGVATCLIFGPSEAVKFSSVEDLFALVARPASILFLLSLLGFIAACLAHIHDHDQNGGGKFKVSAAACYPAVAGTTASISALVAKILTNLSELDAPLQTKIICIACLVSCAVLAPIVNNKGLGRYPPLLLVPIFSATFVVMRVFCGGVVYNEFSRFTLFQSVAYLFGMSAIVTGVLLLTSKADGGSSFMTKEAVEKYVREGALKRDVDRAIQTFLGLVEQLYTWLQQVGTHVGPSLTAAVDYTRNRMQAGAEQVRKLSAKRGKKVKKGATRVD